LIKTLRIILTILIFILGSLKIIQILHFCNTTEGVFKVDFIQFNLLGAAITNGINPYQNISSLLKTIYPETLIDFQPNLLPHPTPYFLFAGHLYNFVFNNFIYDFNSVYTERSLWFIGSCVLFVLSIYKNFRYIFQYSLTKSFYNSIIIFSLLIIFFKPLELDLTSGQINSLLLFSFTLFYIGLYKNRNSPLNYFLMSISLNLKPNLLLILFNYSIKLKNKLILLFLTGLLIIFSFQFNKNVYSDYLLSTEYVSRIWFGDDKNLSILSFLTNAYRYFFSVSINYHLSLLFGFLLTLATIIKIVSEKDDFRRFWKFIILSLFFSPVAWQHYLVFLLPLAAHEYKKFFIRKKLTVSQVLLSTILLFSCLQTTQNELFNSVVIVILVLIFLNHSQD
jgi:hypothetical protein